MVLTSIPVWQANGKGCDMPNIFGQSHLLQEQYDVLKRLLLLKTEDFNKVGVAVDPG
jgi:hypothetical protein